MALGTLAFRQDGQGADAVAPDFGEQVLGVRRRCLEPGLKSLAERFAGAGTVRALDRLNLDGLLALWHPPS